MRTRLFSSTATSPTGTSSKISFAIKKFPCASRMGTFFVRCYLCCLLQTSRRGPSSGQSPHRSKRLAGISHSAPLSRLSQTNPLRWALFGFPAHTLAGRTEPFPRPQRKKCAGGTFFRDCIPFAACGRQNSAANVLACKNLLNSCIASAFLTDCRRGPTCGPRLNWDI